MHTNVLRGESTAAEGGKCSLDIYLGIVFQDTRS